MHRIRGKIIYLAITFAFLFFLVKLFTLSDYGINWDEGNRNVRGQAYIHYFFTGEKNYKNLSVPKRSIYQSDFFSFDTIINWGGHPPFGDILSSFSNFIFYQNLGILGDIESHHLSYIIICSLLVGLIFYFVGKEYGLFAGFTASLALAFNPFFFGHSSFNFKDPVQASFYAAAVIFFYKAFSSKNWKLVLFASALSGMALAVKFNILFAIFIFIPWLAILHWDKIKKLKWPFSLKMTISLIFAPIISFGIVIASWPYLWQNPLKLINIFNFYKKYGTTYFQPPEYLTFGNLSTYPAQWVLFATPIIILILASFGILYAISHGNKEKNKLSFLILFWFLIPILRVTAPHTGVADGMNEVMEYIPPMAILAGIGAKYIVEKVSSIMYQVLGIKQINKKNLILNTLYIILIFSFIPITLKIISIHPNENVYFNPLIGGLMGAKEKNFSLWGNTYGNAYRQAANWLNKNAENKAKVDLGLGYLGNMPYIWLRKDIDYSNKYRSDLSEKGEYIVEMTGDFPGWPKSCYLTYAKNFLNPVYEVKVDDVAILTIWKNDKFHKKTNVSKDVLKGCVWI